MTDRPSSLLLGSYGRGNLGDDVFLVAAGELFSHHNLYINSADDSLLPLSASNLAGTISTTSPRDALKKIKIFLKVKNIIYFGGDVWVELYGDRFPRKSLYKMIALNTLARIFGKKVHYVGCGIGRLSGWSLRLARMAAGLSSSIIAREKRSAELLGMAGIEVLPDLAVNLPYYQPRLHSLPAKRPFTIGISLLYHLPDPEINFSKMTDAIARFATSLPADKFRVILLPMLVSANEPLDDMWASQQIADTVREMGGRLDIYKPESLQKMVDSLGKFDLVIGARLHANILATFNATPCIGIAYRPKVRSFFADNGLAEYCLELDDLNNLSQIFIQIYKNYSEVAEQFYQASERNLSHRSTYQELVGNYE